MHFFDFGKEARSCLSFLGRSLYRK